MNTVKTKGNRMLVEVNKSFLNINDGTIHNLCIPGEGWTYSNWEINRGTTLKWINFHKLEREYVLDYRTSPELLKLVDNLPFKVKERKERKELYSSYLSKLFPNRTQRLTLELEELAFKFNKRDAYFLEIYERSYLIAKIPVKQETCHWTIEFGPFRTNSIPSDGGLDKAKLTPLQWETIQEYLKYSEMSYKFIKDDELVEQSDLIYQQSMKQIYNTKHWQVLALACCGKLR